MISQYGKQYEYNNLRLAPPEILSGDTVTTDQIVSMVMMLLCTIVPVLD